MTPDLPLEFLVYGRAVSLQASARSRQAWKATVHSAGRTAVGPDAWALEGSLAVTIYYFPGGEMDADIDNIVKPILDGLTRNIYLDDRQVERLVVQRFEPERIFTFATPSPVLAAALRSEGSVVYVRLTDDPHGDLV